MRLRLEALEARENPAGPGGGAPGLVVDTLIDVDDAMDNVNSLREAIDFANEQAGTGQQRITFAANLAGGTSYLQSQLPELVKNIFIDGPASRITVERDATAGDFRLFKVKADSVSTIARLNLKNGLATSAMVGGGAIWSRGNLTITSCAFENNVAQGAGWTYGEGGAILANIGTLDISNSTFLNNTATCGGAIGLSASTAVTITSTTMSLNYASKYGGAIFADYWQHTLTLDNVDMGGNIAVEKGGGIYATLATLVLSGNSNIHGNVVSQAGGVGGGVYLNSGTINYLAVTIGYNSASVGDGLYIANSTRLNVPGLTLQGGDTEWVV